MSFLSDLFKGNFSSLGTDITHAPESLATHPDQLAETIGAGTLGLGGLGLAGGLGAVGDLFGEAGTAISDTAGNIGSGISDAARSVGSYFGLGSGSDLATGASTAADLSPTGAAYGVPDAAGVALQDPATFAYTGETPTPIASPATANTPVSTPFGSLSSTGGVLDPGSGTPAGSFGTGGSDFTASTGITGDYGTTLPSSATPAAGSDTTTLGQIGSYLKSNSGALTLGGAGLAANLAAPLLAKLGLTGSIPNQAALTGVANQASTAAGNANAYAGALEAPLTTGVLPAGAQAQVTQALNDSITSIKSKYANLGLTGSTAEQAAISEAQSQAQQMTFTIAQQMAQTGIQAGNQATQDLGLEGTIYNDLTQAQISQDTALQNAIASFTGAIGGGVGRGLATNAVKTATT
jgi:hypothetical protein